MQSAGFYPARKKEPVRFILPLLCAIFAPDTNVMN